MVKSVFIDRDGTINKLITGRANPKQVAPWTYHEFEYIDGVEEAISNIKHMGFSTHVITNQPDVYDGLMDIKELDLINNLMKSELNVDTISCAMYRDTDDYKPNNGMIEKIIKDFKVTRSRSYMIGDTWKDIVAGHKSELTTIFLGEVYTCPDDRYKSIKPDYLRDTLLEASKLIDFNNNMKSELL